MHLGSCYEIREIPVPTQREFNIARLPPFFVHRDVCDARKNAVFVDSCRVTPFSVTKNLKSDCIIVTFASLPPSAPFH